LRTQLLEVAAGEGFCRDGEVIGHRRVMAGDARIDLCGGGRRPASKLPVVRVASPTEFHMFLGTPRRWWIASGVLVLAGIALVGSGFGGDLSIPEGVILLVAGMVVYAAAPMRYGRGEHTPSLPLPASPPASASPPAAASRPRAELEAGDTAEV
jgi:hypothetical protein